MSIDIEQVVSRLKKAREAKCSEAREEGLACGQAWAAECAEPEELKEFAKLQAGCQSRAGLLEGLMSWYPSFGAFIRAAARDNQWTDYMDEYAQPFAEGVVEGAKTVWEQVVDRL